MYHIFIFTLISVISGNEIDNSTSISDIRQIDITARTESLMKLLKLIALRGDFKSCILDITYDPEFGKQSFDYSKFLRDALPSTIPYIQETTDRKHSFLNVNQNKLTHGCKNHLVFLKDIDKLTHILNKEPKSKMIVVTDDTNWGIKNFLSKPSSKYLVNLLVIGHSMSSKAEEGTYILYTHEIFSEDNGASIPKILGSWKGSNLSRNISKFFPNKLNRGFKGHSIKVAVVENPPFAIKKSVSSDEQDTQWDGLEVRLLDLIADIVNLKIEYKDLVSSEIDTLNSALKDVEREISIMAIGGIYQTFDVTTKFDFTVAYDEDCASFVSLTSAALPKYQAILGPFQLSVWLLLCGAYFFAIIPLSLNSQYSVISIIKSPSKLNEMFWFVFSYFTNSFIVKNPLAYKQHTQNSTLIFLGIYWVFTIIVTACYTGSIVAFITFPSFPPAIEDSHHLLDLEFRIGTLDHNGWKNSFNETTEEEPYVKKLFHKIEYVPSISDGVRNASQAFFWPYAFLASRTALDYIVQTDFAPQKSSKRTLMHISEECFARYNVGFLLTKKSIFTGSIDKALSYSVERGFKVKIEREIDTEIQRLAMRESKQITKGFTSRFRFEDRALALDDAQGMFLLLAIGFTLAITSLCIENVIYYVKMYFFDQRESEQGSYWGNESLSPWTEDDYANNGLGRRFSRITI